MAMTKKQEKNNRVRLVVVWVLPPAFKTQKPEKTTEQQGNSPVKVEESQVYSKVQ